MIPPGWICSAPKIRTGTLAMFSLGPLKQDTPITTQFHANCVCNEIVSLTNRVLSKPECTINADSLLLFQDVLNLLSKEMLYLSNDYVTLSVHDLNKYLITPLAKRYTQAHFQTFFTWARRDLTRVTMFIKWEKQKMIKRNEKPRAIQYPDFSYTALLMMCIKPLEHSLYRLCMPKLIYRFTNLPPLPIIAKGKNNFERARLIVKKFINMIKAHGSAVVISLDASEFDKYVDAETLKAEGSFYCNLNSDPRLKVLMASQLNRVGKTRNGVKYKTKAGRKSGDANTALGNCIVMSGKIIAILLKHKIPFDILDDGDDILVYIPRDYLSRIYSIFEEEGRNFGMKLKVEEVAYDIESIAFCQCKPVQYAEGRWKMVRNPVHELAGLQGKWVTKPCLHKPMLKAIGQCTLALCLGIPILEEYARALIRNAGDVKAYNLHPNSAIMQRYRREAVNLVERPITAICRDSFSKAYDIDIGRQIDIENRLRSWNINFQLENFEFAKLGDHSDPPLPWHYTF